MLVIGTAGHIDHGKSSIVKRLTGTDPDRLPEEKARGMTIDLGFAFYRTPDNDTIAFVDVPGHERFVKNMVAGVGSIDAVMLVIAADDGWMPQSQEHFQIVRLLGVRRGMIVINKIDLVEPDWLELLEQEVRDKVGGTFLDRAPVLRVSSQTGDGFDALRAHLNELPGQIKAQRDIGKARLYIDRSFVRPGIGGVVTGTLRGGTLTVGQTVSVWPSRKTAKIRSLHSNNRDVQTAVPGQRTAVSFTGLEKEYLVRGGVITDRSNLGFFSDYPVLVLDIEVLRETTIELTDRRRVLLIVGTTEAEGEIRLYENRQIKPGEKGLALFKPDDPILSLVGDHFIVRLPTPMVTIGGGQIVDHLPHFPRRRQMTRYRYLRERTPLTLEKLVTSELEKQTIMPLETLLKEADFSRDEIESQIKKALQKQTIKTFEGAVYHESHFKDALEQIQEKLVKYLEDKSHLKGLTTEQTSSITGLNQDQAKLVINFLLSSGTLVKVRELFNLAGRGMSLKGSARQAHEEIMKILESDRYSPPTLATLANRGKAFKDAVKFIVESGQGYKCGSDFIFLAGVWDEIVAFIKQKISSSGKLTVADLRDKFGFSRKYAIPILEETDRTGLTRREGDYRVKGARFEVQDTFL
ncbi:MAG: selenocysteine-specific translation elongation factor [Candidatus Zixiibacteriota bacterium]|nr:MAG: selenocysteine-specific translation elongation factor [candidate division Zixibacteria bacterium]